MKDSSSLPREVSGRKFVGGNVSKALHDSFRKVAKAHFRGNQSAALEHALREHLKASKAKRAKALARGEHP